MALSESHGMHLALDYNNELYPLTVGSRFTFALASSLSRSVDPDESDVRNVWRPDNKGRVGIEKDYDYVMYGKVRNNQPLPKSSRFRFDALGIQIRRRGRRKRVRRRMFWISVSPTDYRYSTAYASFGGLLMALTGSFRHLQGITLGENVYLLMRQ